MRGLGNRADLERCKGGQGCLCPTGRRVALYLENVRFERFESFLLTHIHGCGPVLADSGHSRPIIRQADAAQELHAGDVRVC